MQRVYDLVQTWGALEETVFGLVLAGLAVAALLARHIRSTPVRFAAALSLMVAGILAVMLGASVLFVGFGKPGLQYRKLWVGAVIMGCSMIIFGFRAIRRKED